MSLVNYIGEVKRISKSLSNSESTELSEFMIASDIFKKYINLPKLDKVSVIKGFIDNCSLSSLIISSEKLALGSLLYDKHSSELIFASLICLSIEGFRLDPRESILRLSVVWYVANKQKLELNPLIKKINQISSDYVKENFKDFFSRENYLKSPRAMGFKIVTKGDKIYLEQRKPIWS